MYKYVYWIWAPEPIFSVWQTSINQIESDTLHINRERVSQRKSPLSPNIDKNMLSWKQLKFFMVKGLHLDFIYYSVIFITFLVLAILQLSICVLLYL